MVKNKEKRSGGPGHPGQGGIEKEVNK